MNTRTLLQMELPLSGCMRNLERMMLLLLHRSSGPYALSPALSNSFADHNQGTSALGVLNSHGSAKSDT